MPGILIESFHRATNWTALGSMLDPHCRQGIPFPNRQIRVARRGEAQLCDRLGRLSRNLGNGIDANSICCPGPDDGVAITRPALDRTGNGNSETAASMGTSLEFPVEDPSRFPSRPSFAMIGRRGDFHVSRIVVSIEHCDFPVFSDGQSVAAALASPLLDREIFAPGLATVFASSVSESLVLISTIEPDEVKYPVEIGHEIDESMPGRETVICGIWACRPRHSSIFRSCGRHRATSPLISAGRRPNGDDLISVRSDLRIESTVGRERRGSSFIHPHRIGPRFSLLFGTLVKEKWTLVICRLFGIEKIKGTFRATAINGNIEGENAFALRGSNHRARQRKRHSDHEYG